VVEQRRDLAQRLDQRIYVKYTNTRAKRLVIKS
jgi:hypothetical protein